MEEVGERQLVENKEKMDLQCAQTGSALEQDSFWDKVVDFFYFADYYILMCFLMVLFLWMAFN